MIQKITLVLFIFISLLGFSQTPVQVELDIKVVDYVSEKKLPGANVAVYDGATQIKSGVTPSNGNIKFSVPAGKKYKVEISKAGKVSRYFFVDSKGIEAELIQGKNKITVGPDIKLFDQIANVDYSFVENNPITEFYFDLTSSSVVYDQVMSNKMQKKIESLIADAQKKDGQNDALYQKAIEGADGWYKEKKYDLALAKYEEASLLKPKEQYPKDKIKELDGLVKAQKQANLANQQKEEQYKTLIATADALRDQKKYTEAVAKYNEALKIKDEQYAKDQIANANKLIEAAKSQAAAEASFKSLIASADALFNQKSYAPSKEKFLEALKIKPSDEYSKKKIAEIDIKLKEESSVADKKKKYQDAISAGDQLFAAAKWNEAKLKYNEAIAVDNLPPYPKDKIKEIDLKIAEELKNKDKNAKYAAAMKLADDLMATNKLNEAKVKYTEASAIDPTQTLPKENIKKIDQLLLNQAEAAKTKEKITTLLKDGNAQLTKNDLQTAKTTFQEVLKLDASNADATAKLAQINTKLNQLQSQAQLDEKFKTLKAKGIELFKAENYVESKQNFTEAKGIKADPEVDKYLADITTKMAGEQAFQKLMQDAQALESSNIDGAIAKYKEALAKKPSSELAKTKISDLEKAKANKAGQAEIDKKYAAAMKKGNDAFAMKKYLDAIKAYNEALTYKPSEKEPVDKAAEAQRLEEANKSDIDKQYQKILEVGQKAIDEKDWAKGKEMFNRALSLRPDDLVPKNKLKEIEELIKAEKDAKLNAAEKDKNYNLKISEAEKLASKKDYDKAIELFQQAGKIKPEELLPPKRIQELTDLKNKDLDANKQEALYNEYIKKGDVAVQSKKYTEALTEYQRALGIKAKDKVAQAKIAEVQQLIDNEANLSANQKVKEEFDALIKEADVLFADKNWKEARSKYETALGLISTDKYAKNQVDKCIKNIKNKPDEDIQYQKIISKADENFGKAKYDKAKELYERALSLKNSDPYPKQKLDEIEAILHPVVVKQAEPLESLGELSTENPEKVHEALVKAELERKNKKNTKLKKKSEGIQNTSGETATSKETQILGSANTISEIEKKNMVRDDNADENRRNTVEQVKTSETQINASIIDAGTQKYNESLNNKDYMNNVATESSKISTETTAIYEEHTKSIKTISTTQQNDVAKSNTADYGANISSQGELSKTQVKYGEKAQDDFDSRKVVEQRVNQTKDSINSFDFQSNTKESDNILNVSNEIEDQSKKRTLKSTEDAKISGNNKEEIKDIEKKIVIQETSNIAKTQEKVLKTDEIVNTNQKNLVGISTEQDKVRQSNVELIKDGSKSIAESDRETNAENREKYLENQKTISKKIVEQDAIKEVERASSDKKADVVDKIDKQNATAMVENTMSDDEQRLQTKNTVSTFDKENSINATEKGKKVDNNISSMKVVTDDLSTKGNTASIEKEDKLKASQGLLDKIASKKIKYDDKIANELGSLYPEGVSQEVFEQKDENGLLKAVVTRRVVVKNGFGQIYIRTQSLSGITYSKNGNPSSEFVWQKETGDAKLTKHY